MTEQQKRLAGFRQAYEQHGLMVYHICLNYLKNPADAEDAVQEVFLKLCCQAHIEEEPHRKYWLIRSAVNYCKDQVKSFWHKRVDLAEVDRSSYSTLTEPEEYGLLEAMFQLPEKQRICLYLFYVQEFTIGEIAAALRITQSSVKMRLKRGREALRLRQEGEST
ncbi:MAG: RNA polymerase sigma factor [Bacillota bacterium]|nr:RNA polymerase sigma factor [Bacillota bacterium]